MSWRAFPSLKRDWRFWATQALLVAFILRALIPAGYMPDLAAARAGTFQIVICAAGGEHLIAVDADGNEVPDHSAAFAGEPCAFAGLAAMALHNLETLPATRVEYGDTALWPQLAVTMPPARAGPQLGSRAPPTLV